MNELIEPQTDEHELEDKATISEPCDEYPGSFFRVPSPPSLTATWSLT
jgi:hypothetical protein